METFLKSALATKVLTLCVFVIVLLTVTLSNYVTIFNPYVVTETTRLLPIPEAEIFVGDMWPRLEVDFRSGNNTFVFFHIQKTGGKEFAIYFQSLQRGGESLCQIRNISNYRNRIRSGKCYIDQPTSKEMWLVSETTFGWPCGVHPLLMEVKSCLPIVVEKQFGKRNRTYQFFTLIRHPMIRYISEFHHVNSIGNWRFHYRCNGTIHYLNETGCVNKLIRGVTLKDFMSCSESWSKNRQTLMLADVDKAGCLNPAVMSTTERDSILLETAKRNLKEMIYFGVTEYMKESVLLIEHRFDVKFDSPLSQPLTKDLSIADLLYKVWSNSTLYKEISSINYLDMQLYEYALKLFDQRLQQIRINIDFKKTDKEVYSLNFKT